MEQYQHQNPQQNSAKQPPISVMFSFCTRCSRTEIAKKKAYSSGMRTMKMEFPNTRVRTRPMNQMIA